jgi:abortive infection bacteriophage resistance protein
VRNTFENIESVENRVPRRIFRPKKKALTGEKSIRRIFIVVLFIKYLDNQIKNCKGNASHIRVIRMDATF